MLNTLTNRRHFKDHKTLTERQQRIYDFLYGNGIGVLSSVDPNGNPHGVVIYYTISRSFEVEFLTKAETKKYDNLKHNNHVTLTVFEPRSQTTAQIIGKAQEVKNGSEINGTAARVLGTSLRTSDAGLPPLSKLQAGEFVAFKIEPVQIRMAVYARPDPGDYSQLFETIESFELKNEDD